MRAEPNTDIMQSFKSLSFANNQDFIKALRYTNGVALGYISYACSDKFPFDTYQGGELLRNNFEELTFVDVFFESRDIYFTGNIYGWVGATPGLKNRAHKEELLEIVEQVAGVLPRRTYPQGDVRPVYFVRPPETFDWLLNLKGYKKHGNRRCKEI